MLLPVLDSSAQEAAKLVIEHSSLFLLGKGYAEAIAHEISLKIKEVSYIHSEAYNASSFKHGPLAIIDPTARTPVIVLILNDCERENCISTYQQLIGRNATVIVITNCADKFDSEEAQLVVEIPDHGDLSAFYSVFFGQLLAYHLAIMKGYNPDKPRNLSKEITTK